jgi:hypothetical protein
MMHPLLRVVFISLLAAQATPTFLQRPLGAKTMRCLQYAQQHRRPNRANRGNLTVNWRNLTPFGSNSFGWQWVAP